MVMKNTTMKNLNVNDVEEDSSTYQIQYVKPRPRDQMKFMCIDDLVDRESDVRLIDAFVNNLDITKLGINTQRTTKVGRPKYDPALLLKLYIYGYNNKIRSSRKLMDACKINLEAMWLVNELKPDFRTIADFRKENAGCLRKLLYEFNKRLSGKIEWGFTSIDGSKFRANNARNKNLTLSYADNTISESEKKIDEYLKLLNENDKAEDDPSELTIEELENRIKYFGDLKEEFETYRDIMVKNKQSQLSLTDPDARQMKTGDGFEVCYNPQTAVDSNTHLIHGYNMTNQPTDHGQLFETMKDIRQENPDEILQITADKGYRKTEDLSQCLENGIVPNVITSSNSGNLELQTPYEECNDCNPESTSPEDLKKCLRAGIIPDAYKDIISNIEVKDVKVNVYDDAETTSPYGTIEEMKKRAAEGYFVFNPEDMSVYCPAGNIMRKTTINRNGSISFANKAACYSCQFREKCGLKKTGYKTASFNKNLLERPNKHWLESENKNPEKNPKSSKPSQTIIKKVVSYILHPNPAIKKARKCLSEHPFGTIKRSMGATYFLLRGLIKVEGEFALLCLSYNIKRAKNLLGFDTLMELMTTAK